MTLKTHKPCGEVEFRPIHAVHNYPLSPAFALLSHLLAKPLGDLDHLMKDSFALSAAIGKAVIPSHCTLVKMDIKDFFLAGSHQEILAACSSLVQDEFRSSFRDLAEFVLRSQYVRVGNHIRHVGHIVDSRNLRVVLL